MKTLSLMAAVLALGLTFTTVDAEAAKRLGSGSSYGMQRKVAPPARDAAVAPAKAPTAAQATTPPPAAVPQAQPKRSWMGPLAGLAAGLGLAALASHFGFGEGLASMLMIGLLVMAGVAVIGFFLRRRAPVQQPAMAGAGVGAGAYNAPAPTSNDTPWISRDSSAMQQTPLETAASAGAAAAPAVARNIPQDFDVAGFERQAKLNFIRLQAANDAGNLNDLREFTTPELFEKLKADVVARGGAGQNADVLEINAEVLEVAEEGGHYVVSVHYHGLIREDQSAPAEAVSEIWHLQKPRTGQGGWLLAGVQQVQ